MPPIFMQYCDSRKLYNDLMYGIAAFDLEYEDSTDACSDWNRFNSFSRLHMVRKLVNHMKDPSAEHYPHGCWEL